MGLYVQCFYIRLAMINLLCDTQDWSLIPLKFCTFAIIKIKVLTTCLKKIKIILLHFITSINVFLTPRFLGEGAYNLEFGREESYYSV
jgi:hypothetical protein